MNTRAKRGKLLLMLVCCIVSVGMIVLDFVLVSNLGIANSATFIFLMITLVIMALSILMIKGKAWARWVGGLLFIVMSLNGFLQTSMIVRRPDSLDYFFMVYNYLFAATGAIIMLSGSINQYFRVFAPPEKQKEA